MQLLSAVANVDRALGKEAGRTCMITMVHGTWGRGFFPKQYRAQPRSWWRRLLRIASPPPRWFHEGSVFRSRLESELRKENIAATFRPFEWTGANSVFHRACAADELKILLASDPDNANSIVIAHSHGGNVAFRAISKLGSRGARIHLITLATPFLRVFPTWSGPGFLEAVGYLFFAIAIGVSMVLWPEDWPKHVVDTTELLAKVAFLGVVPLVTSVFLARLIINPSPPPAKRQLNRQIKTWAWRPFIIAEATNYDSAGPYAPNLLVIRGVDDEAALMLAFGAIATRINGWALGAIWKWSFLFPAMLALANLIPLVLLLLGYDVVGRWPEFSVLNRIQLVGSFILILVTAFGLLAPALIQSSRFGREFLFGATRCEVATDSVPDSTRSRIITLETPYQPFLWGQAERSKQAPSSTSSMRHKIYNHPSCVPEIVNWINEHVR